MALTEAVPGPSIKTAHARLNAQLEILSLSKSVPTMSKATLYTFKLSVWSAAADVARIELGLADEIEPQQVDLLNAENMSPAFLKKVPSSTLPAIIDGSTVHSSCTEVIDYMVKKSSTKVTPRTELSTIVHADDVDPNFMLIAARDETEVGVKGSGLAGFFLSTRVGKMKEFVSTPDAEPFKAAIEAKIIGTSGILAIYNGTAPAEAKAQFIAKSKATFDAAGKVIYETLPSAISSGPFIAGATPGEDDFHVIAWLSRTALTLGAEKTTDTAAVFEKTYEKPLPDSIKALLDAWSSRESYKSTYAEGKNH